ncbi:MAG: ketopantoate reductase family protein [Rhizobiaceae bacterium]
MRIMIVGAGAMGASFGAVLAEHEIDVWLVDSWREHVDAINRDGLRIDGHGGDRIVRVKATCDAGDAAPADLALLFVKSYQTEQATRAAVKAAGEHTVFLTLQNGYGNHELIEAVAGKGRVVLGTTFHSAVLNGPGHVTHTHAAVTTIGEPDQVRSERVDRIAKVLTDGGIPVEVTDRIMDGIWSKVYINAVFNATCALTGYRSGEIVAHEESKDWAQALAEETLAVIRAIGVTLPYENPIEKLWQVSANAGNAKSSMLQDVEGRRRTEVDSINGAVVKAASRVGLKAPFNEALVRLIHMLEARYAEKRN